jgi:hypothetical protein
LNICIQVKTSVQFLRCKTVAATALNPPRTDKKRRTGPCASDGVSSGRSGKKQQFLSGEGSQMISPD